MFDSLCEAAQAPYKPTLDQVVVFGWCSLVYVFTIFNSRPEQTCQHLNACVCSCVMNAALYEA